MGLAGFLVCADLDGIFCAKKEFFNLPTFEMGEMFSEQKSMVKSARADVVTGGWKGNDSNLLVFKIRKRNSEKFG